MRSGFRSGIAGLAELVPCALFGAGVAATVVVGAAADRSSAIALVSSVIVMVCAWALLIWWVVRRDRMLRTGHGRPTAAEWRRFEQQFREYVDRSRSDVRDSQRHGRRHI